MGAGGSAWPRTAAGVASLFYAGIYEDDSIDRGLGYLVRNALPGIGAHNQAHYYYGHYYAMDCIALLPEAERPVYYRNYARIIVSKQERDGSWWDYPLYDYHQPYGTAFALMTLQRCQEPTAN